MKFVLSTQELNQLINKIQNVAIAQKPAMPILSNFLVEAYNDELILTATDLSLSVRCYADAQILEEGHTTLPAKTLSQLTRELTAPTTQFATNNHVTTLVSGTSRFKIPGMSKETFPTLPHLDESSAIQIKQSDLKELIYQTSFAVAKDESRYALMGSLMEINQGQMIFVGTDGKRLARAFKVLEFDPQISARYIIPAKSVDEIYKNLGDEGEAKIYLMKDKIAVEANHTLIITKLLTGDYPDFSRIIPTTTNFVIHLHKEELISLLRQISLFRDDASRSVRFTFGQGELKLSANTPTFGEGMVSMAVDHQEPTIEVAYHPGYLLDILRHCKNETVAMGLIDPYNPSVLTDGTNLENSNEATPLFVMMPMRLAE